MSATFHTRRTFLQGTAALALASRFPATLWAADEAATAVALAHAELWRRFVDEHGIVLDETALDGSYHRPTPEECRLGKPNAVGWLTPIADGAMFTGLYLDAMVNRALQTKADADQAKGASFGGRTAAARGPRRGARLHRTRRGDGWPRDLCARLERSDHALVLRPVTLCAQWPGR